MVKYMLQEGRVCIKRYGRDAGSRAVVTKVLDDNFVMITTAARRKERRCNVKHLEFLNTIVDAHSKEAVDKELGVK